MTGPKSPADNGCHASILEVLAGLDPPPPRSLGGAGTEANGVHFAAGIALGSGMTITPTCWEDEGGKLHFEVKHLSALLWREPSELVQVISARIDAVVGST